MKFWITQVSFLALKCYPFAMKRGYLIRAVGCPADSRYLGSRGASIHPVVSQGSNPSAQPCPVQESLCLFPTVSAWHPLTTCWLLHGRKFLVTVCFFYKTFCFPKGCFLGASHFAVAIRRSETWHMQGLSGMGWDGKPVPFFLQGVKPASFLWLVILLPYFYSSSEAQIVRLPSSPHSEHRTRI